MSLARSCKRPARGTTARTSKGLAEGSEERFTAETADRHTLYQLALQDPESAVRFLSLIYEKKRGSPPLHFREDFCGTALYAAWWLRLSREHTSEGFDICPHTLAWGREHNLEPLGAEAERARLHLEDARAPSHRPPQVRTAQNFSYQVFKERGQMAEYLRGVHGDLAPGGVFVMDVYGGIESTMSLFEEREVEAGFTYVWEQESYDPASADSRNHIHFRFSDGTSLERAFTYEWRKYGMPELIDLLREAGFEDIEQYWEKEEKNPATGNRVFARSDEGRNWRAWVSYVAAFKSPDSTPCPPDPPDPRGGD